MCYQHPVVVQCACRAHVNVLELSPLPCCLRDRSCLAMASSPPMARSGRPTGSLRGRCSCQTGFAPPWRFVAAAMVLCGPCVCSHSMKLLGEKHRGTGARTHREHTERPRVRSPLRLATCCCWPPAANESAQASHGVGARHGPGVSSQGLHAHQIQTHSCELRVCACGRLRRWGGKHAGTTAPPTAARHRWGVDWTVCCTMVRSDKQPPLTQPR